MLRCSRPGPLHHYVLSTTQKIDYETARSLWRWAKSRHPNKPMKWIKNKYFYVNGQGRDWCFFGQEGKRKVNLFMASGIAIKRHVKIMGKANPYDPEREAYFESRHDRKMETSIRIRESTRKLWRRQGGKCLVCKQKITEETGWNTHHVVWKVHGGKDGLDNPVLLHPNCHRQLHSLKLEVDNPGPLQGLGEA